jgi:Mannosyltransferase (PIG-V)
VAAGARAAPIQEPNEAALEDQEREQESWWTTLRAAFAIVVVSRGLLYVVAYGAAWFLSDAPGLPSSDAASLWVHWDAAIFLRIAAFGYTDPATDPHATAFFPLFPLLLAGFSEIGIKPVIAGLSISLAASVVAATFLLRLVEEEQGGEVGRRAVLYLCLFPTAVFLVAPYSEALFLAGAIPAFYWARRGRWGWAGGAAAVAMGARLAGVFLVLGLLGEFLRARDFRARRVVAVGASLAGGLLPLVLFCAYLGTATGDPFHFLVDQRLGWGRELVGPVASFVNTFEAARGSIYPANWVFSWRLEVLAAFVGVACTVWAAWRREWGYALYMGSLLGVLMVSTWYFSIPRMLLSLFPIPILLASATRGRKNLHELILVMSGAAAVLGTVVFTQGAWFF